MSKPRGLLPTSGAGRLSCLPVLSTHFSSVLPACFFPGTIWPFSPLRLIHHVELCSREPLGANLSNQTSLSRRSCDSVSPGRDQNPGRISFSRGASQQPVRHPRGRTGHSPRGLAPSLWTENVCRVSGMWPLGVSPSCLASGDARTRRWLYGLFGAHVREGKSHG